MLVQVGPLSIAGAGEQRNAVPLPHLPEGSRLANGRLDHSSRADLLFRFGRTHRVPLVPKSHTDLLRVVRYSVDLPTRRLPSRY